MKIENFFLQVYVCVNFFFVYYYCVCSLFGILSIEYLKCILLVVVVFVIILFYCWEIFIFVLIDFIFFCFVFFVQVLNVFLWVEFYDKDGSIWIIKVRVLFKYKYVYCLRINGCLLSVLFLK